MKYVLAHAPDKFELYMTELNYGRGVLGESILGSRVSEREGTISAKTMKEFSDFVWKNRVKLAFIDLHGVSDTPLDWESVFKAQNLSMEQGYRELNKSIQDFIVGPEYKTLMQSFAHNFIERGEGSSSPSPNGRAWVNTETFKAMIQSKDIPEMRWTMLSNQLAALASYHPDLYRELYGAQLKEYVKSGYHSSLSASDFFYTGFIRANRNAGIFPDKYLPPAYDLLAEAVDRSTLAAEQKREALKKTFFDGSRNDASVTLGAEALPMPSAADWWTDRGFDGSRRVYKVLKKNGVIEDFSDFLKLMGDGNYRLWEAKPDWLFASLSKFSPEIQGEIQELIHSGLAPAGKTAKLDNMLKTAFGQYTGLERGADARHEVDLGHDPQIKALQKVFLEGYESLGASPEHRFSVLDKLTRFGPSEITDKAIIKIVKERPDRFVNERGQSPIIDFVRNHRVDDPLIETNLGEHFLEAKLRALPLPPSKDDIWRFLRAVDEVLPRKSRAKDAYLERVAWRTKSLDLQVLKIIEERKSTNWRSQNSKIVNSMSELADSISDFLPDERLAAIDYLIDPQGRQVPAVVERAFNRVAAQRLTTKFSQKTADKILNHHEVQDRKQIMLDQFQLFAQNSNTEERTPAIDLLLTATPNPLMEADSAVIPERILNHFFSGQRTNEKFLATLSFLEAIDHTERSPSLSYMLSQRREGADDIVSAYQTFDSVGIKAGQLAAIMEMYEDPQSNRMLSKLKDRARPMTKYEIIRELKRTLSHEEFARIEDVGEILGSASIKVVAEIKLHGHKEPVVAVIVRPDADAIIEGHLEVADRFIQRLKANGLHQQAEEYEVWLKPIRKQLALETDLRSEKVQIENASKLAAKMNEELHSQLEGWKFRVPELIEGFAVRRNLLIMDKLPGQSIEQLKTNGKLSAIHQSPLKSTARAWLKGLYEFGLANADPHFGNVLLDESTKTIGLIDQGQGEVFSLNPGPGAAHDDIEKLANFLYSAARKDAGDLVKWGLLMSHEGTLPEARQGELKAAIAETFAQKTLTPSQQVRKIIQAFHKAGVEIDKKFVLGAMKGSLIVQREGYVSSIEFEKILKDEVGAALMRRGLRSMVGKKVKSPCDFSIFVQEPTPLRAQ